LKAYASCETNIETVFEAVPFLECEEAAPVRET